AGSSLHFFARAGGPSIVMEGVVAVAPQGDGLAVATASEILHLDRAANVRRRMPGIPGITMLAAAGDQVIVATRHRGVGTVFRGGVRLSFQDVPGWVLSVIGGPPGTAVAGFLDGTVGIWSLEDGT